MSKVRIEDFYDEDDEDLKKIHLSTHKHKSGKDPDDISEKSKKKFDTCKIKQKRRTKNELEQ